MIKRFLCYLWLCTTMMTSPSRSTELQVSVTEESIPRTFVTNLRKEIDLSKLYNKSVIDNLSFVFLQQTNHTKHLSIDPQTGVIRTASSLDRDRLCPNVVECLLKVDVAVQPARYFQVIKLTVSIMDINDNAPRFPQSPVQRSISESLQPGAIIPIPTARDPDGPPNGVVGYDLQQDDRGRDVKFRLAVEKDPDDGSFDLSLVLVGALDREVRGMHRMTLVARDGGDPPRSGSALVEVIVTDENDNAPRFDLDLYNINVAENSPVRRSLIKVHASDPDDGLNGKVVYRLSSKSSLLYGSLFSVDRDSGWVSLIGGLDFESNASMILEVVAENEAAGASPSTAIVRVNVIDVNDNTPELKLEPETDGFLHVREHSRNHTVIAAVSVFDPDTGSGGRVDCRLQKNDETESTHFALDLVAEKDYIIVTTSDLDREVTESFQLVLICSDGGQPVLRARRNLLILVEDINDHNPQFSQPFYNISVTENNKPGETILRVTATDTDSGKNSYVEYALDQGTDPRFTIKPSTGEISTLYPFDRERGDIYQFRVTASDRGNEIHNSTGRVVIHVLDENDEPPRFQQPEYSFNVSEDIPPGSAIGQLVAEDPDLKPNNRHSFHYLDPADTFHVDRDSGTIFLKRALDREARHEYQLTVTVKDVGEARFDDTATVKVNVDDVNDNSPVIVFPSESNDTVFVPRTASIGHVVAKVVARDADHGENAQLSYSLDAADGQRSTKELFSMDIKLGVVVVNSNLSDHEQDSVDLQVIVQDGGTPPRTSYATLRVLVGTAGGEVHPPGGMRVLLASQFLLIVVGGVLLGLVLLILLVILICCCCCAGGRCRRKRPLSRSKPLDSGLLGSQVLRVDDDISRRSVAADVSKDYGFSHGGGGAGGDVDEDGGGDLPRVPSYGTLNRLLASVEDPKSTANQSPNVMRDSQFNICSACDTGCSLVASPHQHQHRHQQQQQQQQQQHPTAQDGCNFSPRPRLPSTGIALSRSPQLGLQGRWTPPAGRVTMMNNDLMSSSVIGGRSNGLFANDPFKQPPRQVYDDFYFNSGAIMDVATPSSPFDAPSSYGPLASSSSYENGGHMFHSMERPKRRQMMMPPSAAAAAASSSRINYHMMNGNYLLQHPVASYSNLT